MSISRLSLKKRFTIDFCVPACKINALRKIICNIKSLSIRKVLQLIMKAGLNFSSYLLTARNVAPDGRVPHHTIPATVFS